MFSISHLNKKYQYDYSVKRSVIQFLYSSKHLNKKDPFQMVAFINCFVTANKWKWDEITYYNCRRLEFIIQEKLPSLITDKKDIYWWIVNHWQQPYFPVQKGIFLN